MNQQHPQNRPRPNNQEASAIVAVKDGMQGQANQPKVDIQALQSQLAAAQADAAIKEERLVAIERILDNEYHQVGYLVNAAPIRRILEGGGV